MTWLPRSTSTLAWTPSTRAPMPMPLLPGLVPQRLRDRHQEYPWYLREPDRTVSSWRSSLGGTCRFPTSSLTMQPPCFVRTRSTASTTTWARRWSRTSWCWGFVNRIFRPHLELWKHCLHGAFKEPFGTKGPWSYFSEFGIIWEVMQNPLLQILCLVAMEKPASTNSDDIRDDKSQGVEMYLRGAGEQCGPEPIYGEPHQRRWGHQRVTEDPRVARGSTTDTFATFTFSVGNERLGWAALHTVLGQSPELAQDWGVSVVPKRGWWCLLAAMQTQQTGNPCAAQGCRVCQGDD